MQGNGIHLALAPGHTLSHKIVHIISRSKQAVLLGDTLVSGALQFTNPDAHYALDSHLKLPLRRAKACSTS